MPNWHCIIKEVIEKLWSPKSRQIQGIRHFTGVQINGYSQILFLLYQTVKLSRQYLKPLSLEMLMEDRSTSSQKG